MIAGVSLFWVLIAFEEVLLKLIQHGVADWVAVNYFIETLNLPLLLDCLGCLVNK